MSINSFSTVWPLCWEKDYFEQFDAAAHLVSDPELPPEQLSILAKEILPATVHNPVIDFFLRPMSGFTTAAGSLPKTLNSLTKPSSTPKTFPRARRISNLSKR